jgi:hypothetical protein
MLGTYTLTIHSTLTPTLVLAESQTENIVRMVTQDNVLIPTLIAGSIIVVVTVNMIGKVFASRTRERTRREIAAFIAEGSMTPEQGERLMKAGERASS